MNPLGHKGKIAEEYGALLEEMWSGQYSCVTPRGIKQAIGELCPRFAGYAQQDSSEVLAFLLDGLHEGRTVKTGTGLFGAAGERAGLRERAWTVVAARTLTHPLLTHLRLRAHRWLLWLLLLLCRDGSTQT